MNNNAKSDSLESISPLMRPKKATIHTALANMEKLINTIKIIVTTNMVYENFRMAIIGGVR
jgi:hypothetical protein